MSTSPVLFEIADGIATLTLNEAAQMNPISAGMRQGCLQALERVREDTSVRALILTGSGKAFCSGANLSDFDPDQPADASRSAGRVIGGMMANAGSPLVVGLRTLPVPVVCAVNGAAAGGGVGLALAADIVIAGRSAYFYLPFAPALGLVPDLGASWALPRAIGRARALGLTLLGDRLSAEDAARWGLIWACVDEATLMDESRQIATRLSLLPVHAVQEVRELYRASEGNSLEEQLALEMDRQTELADHPAFAEGVRAFINKRKPVFPLRS
jgi:2-(1,2-epoxy-1,2-dihydrophenyl)acetyl-CoA isomerase